MENERNVRADPYKGVAGDTDTRCAMERPDYSTNWRKPFLEMLRPCYVVELLGEVLAFLEHTITDAIEKLERGMMCPVEVDLAEKPTLFIMDQWKNLLINLGFELEEPNTVRSNDIAFTTVFITPRAFVSVLRIFKQMICFIAEMPFSTLRMLLALTENEGNRFFRAMTDLLYMDIDRSAYGDILNNLFERYQTDMKALGFYLNGNKRRVLRWREREMVCSRLTFVLQTLFGDGLCELPGTAV